MTTLRSQLDEIAANMRNPVQPDRVAVDERQRFGR